MAPHITPLNILILSQHAGGEKYGMVYRNFAFAKQWVAMGHRVTIMAASYSHTRHTQPDSQERFNQEEIDGVNFIWCRGNRYPASSQIGRVLAMFLFTLQTWFSSSVTGPKSKRTNRKTNDGQCNYDIVIASGPSPFCIFPAYRIAKKHRAKLVFEVRDLWPKALIELGGVSKYHPFIRLMQYAEDFACKKADQVMSVSANSRDYLTRRGMSDDKFCCIPNGTLITSGPGKPLPEKHQKTLRVLKQNYPRIIGYCGAVGLANGLHILLEALKHSDSRIGIAIMGQGEYLEQLAEQIKRLHLEQQVVLLPAVKRDQVADFLRQVDIAYLGLLQSGTFTSGVSPTKLADYLNAEKPLLYAIGDDNNAVSQSGCGIECQPGNYQDIATAISRLSSQSDDELKQQGIAGKLWMKENLDLEKLAQEASEHFYRLHTLSQHITACGQ